MLLSAYTETTERAKFFQTIQAWPLDEELDYRGWLKNFDDGEEQMIASRILDFFVYYSTALVNQMLINSVSKTGYIFVKYFQDWKHTDFKDRCYYSFIPGESQHPTDSGHLFTRKLRDVLGIPEDQIVAYDRIETIPKGSPVVFVDDFVGSGAQIDTAWNKNRTFSGRNLKEICIAQAYCPVYAPLIVNNIGYKRIINSCTGLNLCATHILGQEYNLFDPSCICWENDSVLYKKGVDLILKKSRSVGIPSSNGKDVTDEKGFGAQGLALAFDHGAPDAIPAFFYWSDNNWIPLIKKNYDR